VNRFVRSVARHDIQRQFRYYLVEKNVPEVALRFLDAIEEALNAISRDPGIGSPKSFPNLPGLRSWPVPGFEDIRIYYIEMPEILRIIRVLHGNRDLQRIFVKEDPSID
jgi:plasmid stabilization system protein ParE